MTRSAMAYLTTLTPLTLADRFRGYINFYNQSEQFHVNNAYQIQFVSTTIHI